MNMASVFKLPVIFVNENNGYGSTTPISYSTSVDSIATRAAAYGMPGETVDGNDVLAVRAAAATAVERAQSGEGPTLLECKTYRWRGHYIGDPELYRSRDEVASWTTRCPIQAFQQTLLGTGVLHTDELEALSMKLEEEVSAAVRFAEESPLPEPGEALEDLYATPMEATR
jgi:pyruvate dehydrogenase E1 component alpha subunit